MLLLQRRLQAGAGKEEIEKLRAQVPAVVLVHARVSDDSFKSRGVSYRLHHGMPAKAEVPVNRESLLYAWMPGLGEALHDVF